MSESFSVVCAGQCDSQIGPPGPPGPQGPQGPQGPPGDLVQYNVYDISLALSTSGVFTPYPSSLNFLKLHQKIFTTSTESEYRAEWEFLVEGSIAAGGDLFTLSLEPNNFGITPIGSFDFVSTGQALGNAGNNNAAISFAFWNGGVSPINTTYRFVVSPSTLTGDNYYVSYRVSFPCTINP
jgi:hypothetical protein